MSANAEHIIRYELDEDNPPRLTPEQEARLDAMTDDDIDYSDIPDVSDLDWTKAVRCEPRVKTPVSIRLDRDLLDWYKAQGPGYQTLMHEVLRTYMEHHRG